MKKWLSCLFILTLCTGCSCTPGGSTVKPTATPSTSPSASPSAMPSASPETMMSTRDYVDYLAERYTLAEPTELTNLQDGATEGYSFGMNNESYYLILLDPTNEQSVKWLNEINTTGEIEVDIDGLPKTMYALVNGNYALISSTNQYADGFREYYDAFNGAQALPSATVSPTPGA